MQWGTLTRAAAVTDLDEVVLSGEAGKATDVVVKIGRKTPITFEQFVRDHRAAFTL